MKLKNKTPKGGCTCVDEIRKALSRDKQWRLVTSLDLTTGREYPVIAAQPEHQMKSRPEFKFITPNFCPFCGKKYPEETKKNETKKKEKKP